jgi:hypothetical protein
MAADKNQDIVMPRRLSTQASAETPAGAVQPGNSISTSTFSTLNQSVQSLRSQNRLSEAIRELTSFEGTASAAVFDFVEVANSGFQVAAYNTATGEYDPEGSRLVNSIVARMDSLNDYSKGFSDRLSIDSLIESCLLEVCTSGGLANELVLNKARLPERISVFAYDSITWKSKGNGERYPIQQGTSGEINLDLATIFVSESHRHANKAYARSMMEPAVNNSWYYQEFIEEMRRTVRRQGHGRMTVSIDAERVKAAATPETQADPAKLKTWMETVRTDVERVLGSLNPEDVFVSYDTAKAEMLKGEGEKSDYVPLLQNLSGSLATSLKASPSIIGLRMEGSQSLSNTESLIFLKVAKALQRPVEANLSRILTLAVRLYGVESHVVFKFNPINLRPEDELEAFKIMKQDRILKLLSLGFYSDDEAAIELGCGFRQEGSEPLSGSMFMHQDKTDTGIDAEDASPNMDPQGRALQPDTPNKAGGESQ